jgi:hypothetical protein
MPETRSMTLTEVEFFRLLPVVINFRHYVSDQGRIAIPLDRGAVYISLSSQPLRRIASLTLAVLEVRIEFIDVSDAAIQDFMACFDRGFHRGGG